MESAYLPDAARNFDKMPNSARIDIATLTAVTGRSRATIYRWIEKGFLPKPRKPGGPTSQNVWIVGDVRKALEQATDEKRDPPPRKEKEDDMLASRIADAIALLERHGYTVVHNA